MGFAEVLITARNPYSAQESGMDIFGFFPVFSGKS